MGVLMLLVCAAFIPALLFGPRVLRGQAPGMARRIALLWVVANVGAFVFVGWLAGMPVPFLAATALIVSVGVVIASTVGRGK